VNCVPAIGGCRGAIDLICSVWRELEVHLQPRVGLAELTKVAEGVTVASDLHDRRTWFNAATALPH
jgi:hypothetical protein